MVKYVLLYDNFYQFSNGTPNISLWYSRQPNKDNIVGYRYARNSRGRIAGIQYQIVGGNTKNVFSRGNMDFLEFGNDSNNSDGLTKLGQILLQLSVESYVYCILGAQAKTRWPIVGKGAMSLQTQEVFAKLVSETIIQDNNTVLVSNMRKAIKDTKVILNMAVSPGIVLVPSNMIILTEMIQGYNNVLTVARKGMKFGENSAVNYLNDKSNEETKKTQLD